MGKTVELTCSSCGTKFTATADVIIPGVSGFTNGFNGLKTFLDPTEPHLCDQCIDRVIAMTKEKEDTNE